MKFNWHVQKTQPNKPHDPKLRDLELRRAGDNIVVMRVVYNRPGQWVFYVEQPAPKARLYSNGSFPDRDSCKRAAQHWWTGHKRLHAATLAALEEQHQERRDIATGISSVKFMQLSP